MRVAFVGESHAAQHLSKAAADKGHILCEVLHSPEIVFISEDTKTDFYGKRDLDEVRNICKAIRILYDGIVVLTSQVPPGFTRSLDLGFYHQSETLRIMDAAERAANPEQIILGSPDGEVPKVLKRYYSVWKCKLKIVSLETAESAKVAINNVLKAQVEAINDIADMAKKVDADLADLVDILRDDRRIGRHAYLTPGNWRDSPHLVRDAKTMKDILG